jgi:hypothetical protein
MKRLIALVVLTGCASPSPTEPTPPAVTATPPPAPAPVADEPSAEIARQNASVAAEPPALDARIQSFVDAANAGDLTAAQALSTPTCWDNECSSFARQAQRKFKVRRTGEPKISGAHAIADADIVCDTDRKCDFVHFLWELEGETWRVADIVEDDDKAEAWLAGTP